MCLHGAPCPIPFNLICNMTTFRKMFWPFDPTPGRWCVYGQTMCLSSALWSNPFNLICNMTTARKKKYYDLLTTPKDHTFGSRVCLLGKIIATMLRHASRTSDSLNEGLPIKMTREKFQRKWYFFYEIDSRFNPRLIHKIRFLIGQVPIEKYGLKTLFLLFNI